MAQWVRALAPQAEGWISRIQAAKDPESDSSTVNGQQKVRVSQVLVDDQYKRMPHVTVGVAR